MMRSPYRSIAPKLGPHQVVVLDYRTASRPDGPVQMGSAAAMSVAFVWLAFSVPTWVCTLMLAVIALVALFFAFSERGVVSFDGEMRTLNIEHLGYWGLRTVGAVPVNDVEEVVELMPKRLDDPRRLLALKLRSGAVIPLPEMADPSYRRRAKERLGQLVDAASTAHA